MCECVTNKRNITFPRIESALEGLTFSFISVYFFSVGFAFTPCICFFISILRNQKFIVSSWARSLLNSKNVFCWIVVKRKINEQNGFRCLLVQNKLVSFHFISYYFSSFLEFMKFGSSFSKHNVFNQHAHSLEQYKCKCKKRKIENENKILL